MILLCLCLFLLVSSVSSQCTAPSYSNQVTLSQGQAAWVTGLTCPYNMNATLNYFYVETTGTSIIEIAGGNGSVILNLNSSQCYTRSQAYPALTYLQYNGTSWALESQIIIDAECLSSTGCTFTYYASIYCTPYDQTLLPCTYSPTVCSTANNQALNIFTVTGSSIPNAGQVVDWCCTTNEYQSLISNGLGVCNCGYEPNLLSHSSSSSSSATNFVGVTVTAYSCISPTAPVVPNCYPGGTFQLTGTGFSSINGTQPKGILFPPVGGVENVDAVNCYNMVIVSDTQLTCVVPANNFALEESNAWLYYNGVNWALPQEVFWSLNPYLISLTSTSDEDGYCENIDNAGTLSNCHPGISVTVKGDNLFFNSGAAGAAPLTTSITLTALNSQNVYSCQVIAYLSGSTITFLLPQSNQFIGYDMDSQFLLSVSNYALGALGNTYFFTFYNPNAISSSSGTNNGGGGKANNTPSTNKLNWAALFVFPILSLFFL